MVRGEPWYAAPSAAILTGAAGGLARGAPRGIAPAQLPWTRSVAASAWSGEAHPCPGHPRPALLSQTESFGG